MILLGLGVVLAVVGATLGADEWRRSGSQHARINKQSLRLELVVLAAVLVGGGVAIAYAGVAP
jgi:uncharacterized membrane protein YbjE (DUF340 family)